MPEKISVIILNYKHLNDTINCIKSLKSTDLGGYLDVYVVDNSPEDGTKEILETKFPKIVYIKSPSNLGFAGGNNLGIMKALSMGSEYILIVNPDVTVGKRFFIPLLKFFKDKKVGLVAPVISHIQKGRKVFGFEGKVDWRFAKPEHRNLKKNKKLEPVVSEFVTFACVLIKKEVFLSAGLLDHGYFMYFEDVDYCLSASKAGFKTILTPTVLVEHRTSSSFAKPTQKLGINFRSHLRFIQKWLPFGKRLIPFLYAIFLYPYLYLLWTYHGLKYKNA